MNIRTLSPIRSIQVEAVIIRADGRIESVGTIAYWHKNPLMRGWHRIKDLWSRIWPTSSRM